MNKNKSNEIAIARTYAAPVSMVWDAWVDPEQVAQWWGPRGFTLTTKSKAVVPGGSWVYTMHGPDGVDYPNITVFHEVDQHARLVYDHGASEASPPLFRVTVNFSEIQGITTMTMTMAFANEEIANQTKKYIKQAGGESTWDRLAEYLVLKTDKKDVFVINRVFEAPLETVFSMFTDKEHLAKWLPPTGLTMSYLKGDIRTGGSSFYCMRGPSGMTMYGKAIYKEIKKSNRIVSEQLDLAGI